MWQLCPEQQGSCHRSALPACWLGAESHMANHLLFEKDNFCMTFLVSCQPANLKVAGQIAYKFNGKWFFYKKQNTLNGSFEVYLSKTCIKKSSLCTLGLQNPKMAHYASQNSISTLVSKFHIKWNI